MKITYPEEILRERIKALEAKNERLRRDHASAVNEANIAKARLKGVQKQWEADRAEIVKLCGNSGAQHWETRPMTDHIYGPNGHIVDVFIEHLKGMTKAQWDAARAAAWDAARDAARAAARAAARDVAWDAARDAANAEFNALVYESFAEFL